MRSNVSWLHARDVEELIMAVENYNCLVSIEDPVSPSCRSVSLRQCFLIGTGLIRPCLRPAILWNRLSRSNNAHDRRNDRRGDKA
jgi:hypothetical protein